MSDRLAVSQDKKMATPNNCCVRFDEAIKGGIVIVVWSKGYYIAEAESKSYWDTALWRIFCCPFCGQTLPGGEE